MNEHRTEQQLIDYAFDLASEDALQQTRAHLDQCPACRQKLEALKAKFATLDLLRDEVTASEDLVARTVTAAAVSAGPRRIAIWRYPWLGAAAAVLVVGVALLVNSTFRSGSATGEPPVVKDERRVEEKVGRTAESMTLSAPEKVAATDAVKPSTRQPQTLLAEGTSPKSLPTPAKSMSAPAETPTRGVMAAGLPLAETEIDEKPPFAPASAIELVVLPRREDVQLTIYNSADLTLVRERRNLTLKKGWNWLQFMWAQTLIDPTSLTLEPLEHKDRVEVQQLVFPPRLRELGRWLIHSEVSGQVPFELTYLTSGLSWRAFYMGTLSEDETTMDLEAYVRVDNASGEDYEDAQTRLIVGKVHLLDQIRELAQRQYAYGSPLPAKGAMMGGMAGPGGHPRDGAKVPQFGDMPVMGAGVFQDLLEAKDVIKEGLSEYFLYTIEGTETIPNTWAKRLLSFEVNDIPVTSLYKYDEERWGSAPVRFVSFANDAEHELGETPLPNGTVRIYGRADAEGHLSYTGGTEVKYIPVGEEIELNLGPARLVKVEPTLMETRTDNYVFDSNDNIAGWDEVQTWQIEIANARAVPVDIEITRVFGTLHWELKLDGDGVVFEKHDVTHARFKLSVPPRDKEVFTYTVTTYYGVREEVFIRRQREQR